MLVYIEYKNTIITCSSAGEVLASLAAAPPGGRSEELASFREQSMSWLTGAGGGRLIFCAGSSTKFSSFEFCPRNDRPTLDSLHSCQNQANLITKGHIHNENQVILYLGICENFMLPQNIIKILKEKNPKNMI